MSSQHVWNTAIILNSAEVGRLIQSPAPCSASPFCVAGNNSKLWLWTTMKMFGSRKLNITVVTFLPPDNKFHICTVVSVFPWRHLPRIQIDF